MVIRCVFQRDLAISGVWHGLSVERSLHGQKGKMVLTLVG